MKKLFRIIPIRSNFKSYNRNFRLSIVYNHENCNKEEFKSLEELKVMDSIEVTNELRKMKQNLTSLFSNGKYEEALDFAQDLERKIDALMGKQNVVYASAVNNLALAQKMVGDYEDALDNYIFSVQLYEGVVGKRHPSYASALSNLGVCFKDAAEKSPDVDKTTYIKRAEEALSDSFEIRKKIKVHIRDIITSRNHLASLSTLQNQLQSAEASLRESLLESRSALGEMDRLTATTLNNLGYVLKAQNDPNKWDEAEIFYRDSVSIRSEILGENHPDTIISMHNLAELLISKGQADKASEIQEAILSRIKSMEGKQEKTNTEETTQTA